jgi:GNAT superfamily N-acetyltransferase
MDSAPDRANSTVTLRDGRSVTLRELDSQDERAVALLLRACSDARERFFARAAQLREARSAATGIAAAAFVACSAEGDRVVGYVAYVADDARDGELAGVVDPAFAGNGLGTALVRRAAAHARENGLELLRIELHPGSEAIATMIRDSGLPSHWDLAYPVARVEIMLGRTRPGWSTP